MKRHVKITVFRYDSSVDSGPHYDVFEIPFKDNTKVLQALQYVRENLDSTLAFRYSCVWKGRRCGTCSMMINGRTTSACYAPLHDKLVIEPIPGFPVIRDLVVDWSEYERRFSSIWSKVTGDVINPEATMEFDKYKELESYAKCIRCLSCVGVCPAYENYPRFAGPAFFVQLARFSFDDRLKLDISKEVGETGLYDCVKCMACEKTCPVDIPIVSSIVKFRARVQGSNVQLQHLKEMTRGYL